MLLAFFGYHFLSGTTKVNEQEITSPVNNSNENFKTNQNEIISESEKSNRTIEESENSNSTNTLNESTTLNAANQESIDFLKNENSQTKTNALSKNNGSNSIASKSNDTNSNSKKSVASSTYKNASKSVANDKNNSDTKADDSESYAFKNSKISEETILDASPTDSLTTELANQATEIKKETEKEKTKDSSIIHKRNWSISVFAAPTFFGTVAKSSILDKNIDKNKEESKMSWSFGGYFNIDSSEKFGMRIGLVHSKVEVTTNNISIYDASNNVTLFNQFSNLKLNRGMTNQTIAENFPNEQEIDFVTELTFNELLFDVRYRFFDNKFTVDGLGGFGFIMMSQNQVKAVDSNRNSLKIGSLSSFDSLIFSANLGVLSSYPLTKNTKIFINPSLGYQFTELKSYSFLLKSGLTFYFD